MSLADPAFDPLPGAHVDFGRLGGTVYQIEVPDNWNHRLVLWMHGYGELRPQAAVSPPDIRGYLIGHGFAWGASSFSSTSSIPGRAVDETAALWDYFAQKYGRPDETYITGKSMGGSATHIAAERYADRFDGALALCGSAGQTPGAAGQADFFAAGAYVAGVSQADFDASTDVAKLVQDRILPALRDPATHGRFENIMLDLTGGPRGFDREGFELEEETNWQRAQILVASRLAPNRDTVYQLGPLSIDSSGDFNRRVIRFPVNDELMHGFADGSDLTGDVEIPLLTLHATGDGQVPIEQARILQRLVDDAGKGGLLVQRIIADAGHCGFTNAEWEAGLESLIGWVERGEKPEGDDVLVEDLTALGTKFALTPRPGTPSADAVPGARERAVLRGTLTVDGSPLNAKFLGALVRRDALVTSCQYRLTSVHDGTYEITIMSEAEATGCGAAGGEIILWTSIGQGLLYTSVTLPWPANGATATFNASFSQTAPSGAEHPTASFFGDVFAHDGERLPPGTRVEAYVGDVLCGRASTRRTGSFSGYVLGVVGPESVPGCERDAKLTFRVDGRRATETATNDFSSTSGHQLDLTIE